MDGHFFLSGQTEPFPPYTILLWYTGNHIFMQSTNINDNIETALVDFTLMDGHYLSGQTTSTIAISFIW